MATRKASEKLTKVTLNLFTSDWDFLKEIYSKSGASNSVRKIIRSHVRVLAEKIKNKQGKPNLSELEIDI